MKEKLGGTDSGGGVGLHHAMERQPLSPIPLPSSPGEQDAHSHPKTTETCFRKLIAQGIPLAAGISKEGAGEIPPLYAHGLGQATWVAGYKCFYFFS